MKYAVCFVTSALIGAGVGGGGFFTLYLSLCGEVSQLAAQGINLISYVFAAAPSSALSYRRYRPDERLITFLSFCSVTGCVFGALTAPAVPDGVLRKLYGGFTAAAALFVLMRR
jgi:uncharacterized membrane protein YfcA